MFDFAIFIDDDGGGDHRHIPVSLAHLVGAHEHRVLQAQLLDEKADLGGVGAQGNTQGLETLVLEVVENLVQVGHLLPARRTEKGEEVEQHHLALILAQGVICALEHVLQGKVRGAFALQAFFGHAPTQGDRRQEAYGHQQGQPEHAAAAAQSVSHGNSPFTGINCGRYPGNIPERPGPRNLICILLPQFFKGGGR